MSKELRVSWSPLPAELAGQQRKLGEVLARWAGTPYKAGKQDLGLGVDCVRFVAAVLDELRGRSTPIETLPDDTAMHQRDEAIAGMLQLRRALAPNELLRWDGEAVIEPGDVIVTGPAGGGPGHAMIVGHRRNEIWESSNTGVRRIGLSGLKAACAAVYYAYRCPDRADWRTA